MRPSIAQRRLQEFQATEREQATKLLATIHDTIENTKSKSISIKRTDGVYILDKEGIKIAGVVVIDWNKMDSCHLLKVYSSILKNMTT